MSLSIKRYTVSNGVYSVNEYVALTDGGQLHFSDSSLFPVLNTRPDYTLFLYRNVKDVHPPASYNEVVIPPYGSGDEMPYFRTRNWILKDVNGNEVYPTSYPGNRFCDIGNVQYQQYVADWYYYYTVTLHSGTYKACFLDNGMIATASSWSWDASTTPINPRTGVAWTDNDVRNAYAALYALIKQRLLGVNVVVTANGIYAAYNNYFRSSSVRLATIALCQQLGGFMCEGWLWGETTAYLPEASGTAPSNWKDAVDMVVDFEAQLSGKNITLVANAPDNPSLGLTTDAQKQQYCVYAYASMLLGIGLQNSYWLYLGSWGWRNMQSLHPPSIGTPTELYYKNADGLYVRRFSNGTVYVNPSTVTRGNMPAHTGQIGPSTKWFFSNWNNDLNDRANPKSVVV